MGLCEDGTKQSGYIEGGQCVDKLNSCNVFSEDSVGRHFVILFLCKFWFISCVYSIIVTMDYFISEEHNCHHIQGRLRGLCTFILNAVCPPTWLQSVTTRLVTYVQPTLYLRYHVSWDQFIVDVKCLNKLIYSLISRLIDHLCGLVVRVSGHRHRGLGFDSRRYQIFWVAVGLERGALSLVSLVRSIEKLLE